MPGHLSYYSEHLGTYSNKQAFPMSLVRTPLFRLIDVSKTFNQGSAPCQVLNRITYDFMRGTSYAITGASGTGKSTLLYLLAGLDTPSSGLILFDEKPLDDWDQLTKLHHARFQRGIILQFPSLVQELTILENCALPGLIAGRSRHDSYTRAALLLDRVGLHDKLTAAPGTLSGGQQQRACIARALVNNPDVVLADEPTANLDPITGQQVIDLLLDCCAQYGVTLIMSTHDAQVSRQAEVHLVLDGKKLVKKPE